MSSPICIDISHHQGSGIDWEEVYASGVLGMIHKATEGTSFVDDMRAENCARALDAGLAIATYHWLSPGVSPVDQMDFYLETVEPHSGERVVIDYEQDGCTVYQLEAAVQMLRDADLDLNVTIYSGHLLKEQLGSSCNRFLADTTDLWLAQYNDDPDAISWPDGTYPQWMLWQYSETGSIPGIADAYVDLNNFNGSSSEFVEWLDPANLPRPTPPKPQPRPEHVHVDVRTSANVQVFVKVNGVLRPRYVRRGPDVR